MGMQQDQLLMHKLIERSAIVAPDEEVVTATEDGVRRQTYRETRARSHQLAHALAGAGIVHTTSRSATGPCVTSNTYSPNGSFRDAGPFGWGRELTAPTIVKEVLRETIHGNAARSTAHAQAD